MIEKLPKEVLKVIQKIQTGGFEIYIVGGAVRDILMKKSVSDWDFATNAKPDEIQKIFPESFYDNRFGTVGIAAKYLGDSKSEQVFEITTYRKESDYSDRRHPDKVLFAKTIEEDLARRDFTINAMALKIIRVKSSELKKKNYLTLDSIDYPLLLVDPFDGQKDLKAKIVRAVGDPSRRFTEDALRLLRAVRFSTQLGFMIEPATFEAIKVNAPLIQKISGERIRDELLKILESSHSADGFWVLRNSGLLKENLPELENCFGIEQKSIGRHHIYDVGTHSVKSLEACPSKDPLVRFATLLHDIGKPATCGQDEKGTITFYNHEVVGAHLVKGIANRFAFSKKDRDRLVTLVRWHQFTVDEATTAAAVRRFIRRVGVENIGDMIDLRIGDRLGGGLKEATSWRLRRFMKMIQEELHPPFAVRDLAVDGHNVMEILGIAPGPEVGKVLAELFEEIEEGKEKNDRNLLLKRLAQIKKSMS